MIKLLTDILPYVASAGAGAVSYVVTGKLRQANVKKINVETEAVLQTIYHGIIDELRKEIGDLREQVFMLRETVNSYKNTCDNCPQRMIKKP